MVSLTFSFILDEANNTVLNMQQTYKGSGQRKQADQRGENCSC